MTDAENSTTASPADSFEADCAAVLACRTAAELDALVASWGIRRDPILAELKRLAAAAEYHRACAEAYGAAEYALDQSTAAAGYQVS